MPGFSGHLGDAFGVEAKHLVAAKIGTHELGPAVAGEAPVKNLRWPPKFLGLGIHVRP